MEIFDTEHINFDKMHSTAVTLGNFDGIHLGHQKLIKTVKDKALKYGLKSVVFSFYPHPMSLFKKDEIFYTILSTHEKKYVIENLGIDTLIQYPFTMNFADMSADDFASMLFEKIKCKVLVVGEDYCFGKNRVGTYNMLKDMGKEKNVEVIGIPSVNVGEERVSSTRIRKCILNKNLSEASILLNKPFFIIGNVSHGKKIGKKIGFPTANIIVPKDKLLPPDGVYITKTYLKDNYFNSITNIGKNPTVGGTLKTVETFVFDFDGDIYNNNIKIDFLEFLRDEMKFNSIDELKKQINIDKNYALKFLKK